MVEYVDHSYSVQSIAFHSSLSGARKIQPSVMQTAVFFLSLLHRIKDTTLPHEHRGESHLYHRLLKQKFISKDWNIRYDV